MNGKLNGSNFMEIKDINGIVVMDTSGWKVVGKDGDDYLIDCGYGNGRVYNSVHGKWEPFNKRSENELSIDYDIASLITHGKWEPFGMSNEDMDGLISNAIIILEEGYR